MLVAVQCSGYKQARVLDAAFHHSIWRPAAHDGAPIPHHFVRLGVYRLVTNLVSAAVLFLCVALMPGALTALQLRYPWVYPGDSQDLRVEHERSPHFSFRSTSLVQLRLPIDDKSNGLGRWRRQHSVYQEPLAIGRDIKRSVGRGRHANAK